MNAREELATHLARLDRVREERANLGHATRDVGAMHEALAGEALGAGFALADLARRLIDEVTS